MHPTLNGCHSPQNWEHEGTWIMPRGFGEEPTAAAPAIDAGMSSNGGGIEDEEQLCIVRLVPAPIALCTIHLIVNLVGMAVIGQVPWPPGGMGRTLNP